MSEESTEEEPQKKEAEKPTLDQALLTRLRNVPAIAWLIAFAVIVVTILHFTNTLYDEWQKTWSRFHPAKAPASFSARVDIIFQRELTLFWITKAYHPSIICDAPLALVISITNLRAHPVVVDYFKVEALDANGKWIKVPHIPLQSSQRVYTGIYPTDVKLMTGVFFDDLIEDRHLLQPHEPVSGWTFFEAPVQVSVVRVTVRDLEGVEFTSGPLTPPTQSIQVSNMNFGDEHIDVTKHMVDYHCGR